MRKYETAIIWSTSLSDPDLEKELTRVQEIITSEEGVFRNRDVWGRRQLAFPISKQTEGIYCFLAWDGEERVTAGIDKYLRINDNCLRYLTLRADGRSEVPDVPGRPERPVRAASGPAASPPGDDGDDPDDSDSADDDDDGPEEGEDE